MTRFVVPGLYTEKEVKRVKEALEGKTYMDFHIECGGYGLANNSIIVSTSADVTSVELLEMFWSCLISEFTKAQVQVG